MLGPVTRPLNLKFPDLTRNEWLVLTPLAVVIFWFGLGSSFWTQKMNTTVTYLLRGAGAEDTDLPAVRLYNAVFDRQSLRRTHASPSEERSTLAWLDSGVDQRSVLRGINPATRPLAAGGTSPAPGRPAAGGNAAGPARRASPSQGATGAPPSAPPGPSAGPGHGGPRITGASR